MDCLYAKCIHCITVLCNGWNWETGAEVLSGSNDYQGSTIWTITMHKGSYADDCLVTQYCYTVTTIDQDLKGRIMKILEFP